MPVLRTRSCKLLISYLCVVGGIAISIRGAEPKYHGKTLSKWLAGYGKAGDGSSEEIEAEAALRAIGTNAVPYLTKWVAEGSMEAADGFKVLGPAAASAVPALAVMLTGTNSLVATLAASSLGYIGEPALPVLMAGLTNKHFRVGTDAALAIVDLGTNARPAIPMLLQDLHHSNHFYRERAADALGKLHIEPETVVPELTRLLKDDSKAARLLAIMGLGAFQSEARSAVPALSAFLASEDKGVRRIATNALRQIAPETLPSAPPR